MNRSTKLFCNLLVLGLAIGLTVPAFAGPTATPTGSVGTAPYVQGTDIKCTE